VGIFPRRGEIYWINFDPARGSEQAGKRPAVILTSDTLNQYSSVVTVVPITSTIPDKPYPHTVRLSTNSLLGEGTILCNQIRTIAKDRLEGNIGELSVDELAAVYRAIDVAFGLPKRNLNDRTDV
jgi:mRNA interferase MazF